MTLRLATRWPAIILSVLIATPIHGQPLGSDEHEVSTRGKRIASEPFEQQPFHEVCIPEWVKNTVGVGYTLSGQSTEQRKKAVELGVTISELGFVDPFYAYYDSKLLLRRSPHVELDHLDHEVAEYRKLGLKILGVYPPCLQSEVYEKHPEWRRIATNTTEIPDVDLKAHPYGGMLCLLGPYGDFFIDVLAEATERFGVDAWSFDGLHYGGVCFCEHCRAAFRKEMGSDIPAVDMNDMAFRRYQHWADRRLESLVERMQVRLKGINPDTALITWTTNAGRFGHFRDIPRNMPARMNLLFDAPDQEFWLDETNRGNTVLPALANAYIWACTNHRVAFSEPYLMSHGNPYGKDSFPGHEIERRTMLALTHGAAPSLAVIQPAHMQAATYHALAEIKKRKEWLTHKEPEPWGAMLVSDNTRTFYGRDSGQVEERYLGSVLGTFRAVVEEHLPVTTICDWNITNEDLQNYKVLVLPNAACLSDQQCAAVRAFVAGGGGLVASLDTSLCDEFGTPREDFALADILGVHRGAAIADGTTKVAELDVNFARTLDASYWQKRKNIFDLRLTFTGPLDDLKLRELLGTEPVTFKGPVATSRIDKQVQPLATLTLKEKPNESPAANAIVARGYGKGRVVYFAAGVDSAYYFYPYPYQRRLISQAIRWAANQPPPVEVEAPMCVHATVFRQNKQDKQRLLVHLYNDVNTSAFHALPSDDVPLREETIPIHHIKISVPTLKSTRVHLEPEGIELPVEQRHNGTTVIVPKLNVHSIVVFELP